MELRTTCIVATLCAAPLAWGEEGDRYEMWEEPSHQLVFTQGPARVLDVRIVHGVTSDFHKHRFATAYVIIQDALVANQFWEGEWSASGPRELRKAGTTVDNANYVDNPYYHRVRNEDDKTFHVVAVINERPLAEKAEAAVAGFPIDNAWFREHRIQVAPGEDSEALSFDNDAVVVQFTDGSSHIIENGMAHGFKSAPAAFSWHPAGSEFRIANRSVEALDFVLFEVRQ